VPQCPQPSLPGMAASAPAKPHTSMGARGAPRVSRPDNARRWGPALQRRGLSNPRPLVTSGFGWPLAAEPLAVPPLLGRGRAWKGQKPHRSHPVPVVGKRGGSGTSHEAGQAAWGRGCLSARCCGVGRAAMPGCGWALTRTPALAFMVTLPQDSRRAARAPAHTSQSSPRQPQCDGFL